MNISSIEHRPEFARTSSDGEARSVPARDPQLWKVSKGFEAILMQYMVRAMRNTVHHSDLTEPSQGRKLFTEMLDGEYAKNAAGKTRGGLAEVIYKYLKSQGAAPVPRLPSVPLNLDLVGPSSAAGPQVRGDSRILSDAQLEPIIEDASQVYGVDRDLIRSVIRQESGNRAGAVSPAGAKGLMQLMDSTARTMEVRDIFNPRQNIMGGVRYLAELLEKYDGDETLALAAYNAGPANVEQYGGVPPFPETLNYVKSVLAIKARLQEHNRGETHVIQDH